MLLRTGDASLTLWVVTGVRNGHCKRLTHILSILHCSRMQAWAIMIIVEILVGFIQFGVTQMTQANVGKFASP